MDDKPKDWVDFAAAKAVRFEVALEALGVLGSLRRDGEQLQGICPLHKASGEKASFGVHVGKQTFNCFACKKHGKVVDFVMQVKGIGAKEAAGWLLSLVDNRDGQGEVQEVAAGVVPAQSEVQESVQKVVEDNGAGVVERLTTREAWLSRIIARGVAWYLVETFKPLSDVETIENCIVAKVAMVAEMAGAAEQGEQ